MARFVQEVIDIFLKSVYILINKLTHIVPKEGGGCLDKKEIGLKLQRLRGGKSRQKVAGDLEIALSTLRMYENGNRIPRDQIKLSIVNYYGVSVEEIFFTN